MAGGVWSITVTVAEQEAAAPLLSVTVRVTAVVPKTYGPAGNWLSVIVSPSGSEEPLLTEAEATEQSPRSVGTTTFVHFAIGGPPPGTAKTVQCG